MFPKKRRRLLVVPDPVGTGADLPKAIEALQVAWRSVSLHWNPLVRLLCRNPDQTVTKKPR